MKSLLFALVAISIIFCREAVASSVVRCGIAVGYPPYQYVNKKGHPAGIDIEVAKLVFKTAGLQLEFVPGEWDYLLSSLIHKTGKIDALCGAEIYNKRAELMDFSEPFYNRHIALFILKDSAVTKISDLYGKVVAGDKDSFFEQYLGKQKEEIRIVKTVSKEESFRKLKEGSVLAVMAPEEVGFYFARELKMEVKTFGERDPGSPVGFAVRKGNKELLEAIQKSLKKLKKSRKIETLLKSEMQKS